MKLNIISWNIRHLRMEKVNLYLATILKQLDAGHVMFFYENKEDNVLGRAFVDAIGNPLTLSDGAGSMRLTWAGIAYQVGTNENVWIVYSNSCTTGPNSKSNMGVPFTITVTANHTYDDTLKQVGAKALKSSTNETVMANLAQGKGKFRIPALVHIIINKPDGSSKTIRVASWHAPGPAQGSSPLLNYYFQTTLAGHIDLFVGDFNMTGVGGQTRNVQLPLTLHRTNTSTTLTEAGPVPHEEGLDLVYMDAARIASGTVVGGGQIGRATVSVIPKPANKTFPQTFELSDHLPVLVTLKGL
jgi:hypothetical protein